jgi:hypothetical protein
MPIRPSRISAKPGYHLIDHETQPQNQMPSFLPKHGKPRNKSRDLYIRRLTQPSISHNIVTCGFNSLLHCNSGSDILIEVLITVLFIFQRYSLIKENGKVSRREVDSDDHDKYSGSSMYVTAAPAGFVEVLARGEIGE